MSPPDFAQSELEFESLLRLASSPFPFILFLQRILMLSRRGGKVNLFSNYCFESLCLCLDRLLLFKTQEPACSIPWFLSATPSWGKVGLTLCLLRTSRGQKYVWEQHDSKFSTRHLAVSVVQSFLGTLKILRLYFLFTF